MDSKAADLISDLNFKVLSREPTLHNITKIIHTVKFAVMALYEQSGKHWNYLKIKGPLFLMVNKFQQHKLCILNQVSAQNFVVTITPEMKIELKTLEHGYMLNYIVEDKIMGRSIYGIWSADEAIVSLYKDISSQAD